MITLHNVEKFFSQGITKAYVLRRIDIDIRPGEFVSIMGPSGAGKSTLLHILGMHDQSWTGEYYFDDVAVHSLDHKKRANLRNRNIGFVFQSYHLLDDQTVFENLELPLSYRDVNKKDRQSIVCDTLDRFQIVGKKDLFPSQLSGGQQQLVGIARAVVANPRIILADEPTGNLHSSQGKRSWRCLRSLTMKALLSCRSRTPRSMPPMATGSCGSKMDGLRKIEFSTAVALIDRGSCSRNASGPRRSWVSPRAGGTTWHSQ